MSFNPSALLSVPNVAALRARTVPQQYIVLELEGYNTPGDGGAGTFYSVYGASPGTYTDDGVTTFVPTGGNGSAAYVMLNSAQLDARQAGVVCDASVSGATVTGTDNSAAIGRLLAVAAGKTIYLSGLAFVSTTQTANNSASGATFTGPGQIVVNGSYTAIAVDGSPNVTWGWGGLGNLRTQQFQTAVTGTQIANSFPSSGFTIQNLTNTSASSFAGNTTVTKSGSNITIALTGDAGLNIPLGVGVIGSTIALNPNTRYVVAFDPSVGGTLATGVACAAPRFLSNLGEYVPGAGLGTNNFDYLTGATTIQVKFGTGRATNTTTLETIGSGAVYITNQLQLLALVNDFATNNFSAYGLPGTFTFSACNNLTITGGLYQNLWSCTSVVNSQNTVISDNKAYQCLQGFGVTTPVGSVKWINNTFDGSFTDENGIPRYQVVARTRAIVGNIQGAYDIVTYGNDVKYANVGIEFINIGSNPVSGIKIGPDDIDFCSQGVSINYTSGAEISTCTIRSSYPFTSGIIEMADPRSFGSVVSNCILAQDEPYAQGMAGVTAQGSNVTIKDNPLIKSTVPIVLDYYERFTGWLIDNNNLQYGNTAGYLYEITGVVSNNVMTAYCNGWVDSIAGYSPGTMYSWNWLYSDENSANGYQCLFFDNKRVEIGLNGVLSHQLQQLGVVNNQIFNPNGYNPPYTFLGAIAGGLTGGVSYFYSGNNFMTGLGVLTFANAPFTVTGVPSAGGYAIINRNYTLSSATAANANSFSGGTVTVITS